jgi:ParB family chromosome partitioning protein
MSAEHARISENAITVAREPALPVRRYAKYPRCQWRKCKKPFPAERVSARFCSTKCRVANHRATSADRNDNDWHSPADIVAAARAVLGQIDLDPASCAEANAIVQAKRFYTIKDDGLRQAWKGTIWLNPPYGKSAPKFVEKLAVEYRSGAVTAACLLLALHHMTSRWFGVLAEFTPSACLPAGRLVFTNSQTDRRRSAPRHSSVILGIGVDPALFRRVFAPFGQVWEWTA